jgi:hypothetical protein
LRYKLLRYKLLRYKLLRYKLLRYKLLRYKLHIFAAFRTADHDVTPRNCTDSKYNPHNDENDMGDWHEVCIFTILLFCLFISFYGSR